MELLNIGTLDTRNSVKNDTEGFFVDNLKVGLPGRRSTRGDGGEVDGWIQVMTAGKEMKAVPNKTQ